MTRPLETVCSFIRYLVHLYRIPGLVHVPKEGFDLCRACRGCRAHCRGTQILPFLVSYISVPSIIERSKQSLKAPKIGSLHVKHLNADFNQGQCNLVRQYKIDDRISCQREASSVSEKPSHLWFDWQGPISLWIIDQSFRLYHHLPPANYRLLLKNKENKHCVFTSQCTPKVSLLVGLKQV